MFDNSQSRLITAEADKTIKIYKEDEEAVREIHVHSVTSSYSQEDFLALVLMLVSFVKIGSFLLKYFFMT